MYAYSPIKKITIKNFRNIGEAVIDFEDSPIISLIGENEQGKTSVVKAIGVCAMHATPRDQKDFIRDGTKGFGVAIELQDGTVVTRIKMAQANSYSVKYPLGPDGKPVKPDWAVSKLDNSLPVAVQEVMGMIEEPETKEFLHIRTYEDQLLFVTTASSTNYKVMYNALKISQLVDAIRLGSKEANALKTSINQTEISADTLNNQVKNMHIYDLEPIENIKARLQREVDQVRKIERALEIKNRLNKQKLEAGDLVKVLALPEISMPLAMNLRHTGQVIDTINRAREALKAYSGIDSLSIVNIDTLTKFESALTRKDRVEAGREVESKLSEIDKMQAISVEDLNKFNRALNIKNGLVGQRDKLNKLNIDNIQEVRDIDIDACTKASRAIAIIQRQKALSDGSKQINAFCEQVETWFKQIGVATETCPKCGETIVIDIDKIENM